MKPAWFLTVGLVCVVVGVGFLSWQVGLIVAGLALSGVGLFKDDNR